MPSPLLPRRGETRCSADCTGVVAVPCSSERARVRDSSADGGATGRRVCAEETCVGALAVAMTMGPRAP
jgi:hypothetical protein